MDGILIPVLGFFASLTLCALCVSTPRLRRFTLAALVSPFAASITFLLGSFILADMNPRREYGKDYIPNGTEHDPTASHYVLWLLAVIAAFAISAALSYGVQQAARRLFLRPKSTPEFVGLKREG